MTDQKLIGLAAGGTGGHVFPAEALAQEMLRRDWCIMLFTDERGMRYADSFPADILELLPAANPNANGVVAKAAAAWAMARALIKSWQSIRKYKPDIIVGFGGYPSAPAMLAARLSRTPHGVHEQNAVLGRVNRLVASKANFVAHAFPDLDRLPENCIGQIIELGNPVRDAIRERARAPFVAPAEFSGLDILVFGGSQGASLFSRVVPAALKTLPEALRSRIQVTQQVREDELESTKKTYDAAGIKSVLKAFFDDMPDRLARAHLVISRSGASSVTEIATIGRPAILVPLGISMDDHQTGNAKVLVDRGAAELIQEKDFVPERLAGSIERLLTDPVHLAQMAANAIEASRQDTTARLADLIEELAAR